MAQFAPGATLDPQVELMPNCAEAFIDEIFSFVVPVFVSVTVCAALVVPTACFPKFSGVVGEKATMPVLRSVITASLTTSTITRSGFPSPLKSPATTDVPCFPAGKNIAGWKVPSPLPLSTLTPDE
jgi:hypothetical protein